MVSLKIKNVCVDYPVYSGGMQRSFASSLTGKGSKSRSFRALDNINLEVKAGERVGLIGHNGAGKTTLLRVLGGMIVPTSGKVASAGRSLCLLNISAGFEADKTGYENAKFVARLFGLNSAQVKDLVEDVEEFCELGDFMSMPYRTYSAGMSMRLAFGVYTALPHDILIVDEIIGAGDAKFHEKASARIRGAIDKAQILIIATHSQDTLFDYCDRAIWLSGGKIAAHAEPNDCWKLYTAA